MDIDSMVKQLMQARRAPLDKLQQKKQTLQWQQDAYRDMNSKILDLKNAAFNMKLQSTYLTKKASSSDELEVSATGTATATNGIYKINVSQLAEGAALTSSGTVTKQGGGAITTSNTIADVYNTVNDSKLTIGGEKGTVTIDVKKTATLASFMANVNANSGVTGVRVSFDDSMKRFFFVSTNTGANAKVELNSTDANFLSNVLKVGGGSTVTGSVAFQTTTGTGSPYTDSTKLINGSLTADQIFKFKYDVDGDGTAEEYNFTITNTTTIGSLITQIDSSDLGKLGGVNAQLDAATGKLVLTSPDNTKHFEFSDETTDGNVLSSLGLASVSVDAPAKSIGKNAQIKYNDIDAEFSSNTFSVNGVNFTAKKASKVDINITVSQDTDAAYNSIKTFVDKYNEVLDAVNKKTSEDKYRDYQPLTDDQRKSMSADDIKLWEDKAKSGLLRNDSILSGAVNEFRSDWYLSVSGIANGDFNQLSDIGISTLNYQEKGKLYIDDTKLKAALSNNPEEVMRLFTNDDKDSKSSSGDGVGVRIYEAATRVLDSLKTKAGNSLSSSTTYEIGKQMTQVDKDISTWQTRLTDIENAYYKQFTAMETAMNQYNSQSTYLTGLLSNGSH
ncbi:flagellar filament capping protein FliD [Paenibacillus cremeus]|nr:flagellar filament capping protein FliD [Paenibacillus cremeus]